MSKTVLIDGMPIKTDDADAIEAGVKKLSDAATVANDRADKAEKALTDAQTEAATAATVSATALSDATAKVATLEAEKATLVTELADAHDPAKLRDAAAEYSKVADKAKALGATVADADPIATIKRNAVNIKLGDVAKDWTDAQVDVSFATLTANVSDNKPDAFRDAMANRDVIDFSDAATKGAAARKAMIDGFNAPRETAK